MTTVVQAACPGCKKTLRIPATWLGQPMKCKFCGMVVQARAATVTQPAPRPAETSTAVRPPEPTRANWTTATMPGASSAGPIPRTPVPAAVPLSPAPRAAGSLRKGLFLGFCVLAVAGLASVVYWPQLALVVARPTAVEQARAKLPDEPTSRSSGVIEPPRTTEPIKPPAKTTGPVKPPVRSTEPAKPPVKTTQPMKPPVKTTQPGKPVAQPVRPSDPPPQVVFFPRRALVVSVNNYLYAHPVRYGVTTAGGRSVRTLVDRLQSGLRFSRDQVAELSDAAPSGAQPTVKPAIEKAVVDFLTGARQQDRVLLFFVGHAVEIEDEAYLVPLEGDLEIKETLISLKWLYDQLASCRARQKVLVLDVCRTNPSRGQERPGGGPLGAKLDAALQQPPAGVQVWSACVAGQHSYEFDYVQQSNGVFVDALTEVLALGSMGSAQKPEEPLPLEQLVERVNQRMKDMLDKDQKVQTSRLTGQEPAAGAAYDPSQARPPNVFVGAPAGPEGGSASPDLVKGILTELDLPPVRSGRDDVPVRLEALPLFSAKALEGYRDDGPMTPFRQTVARTRDLLNKQLRGKRLRDEFRAPANENRFRDEIKDYQTREVATVLGELSDALDDLKAAGKERDKEMSKRWQANYDFVLARLEAHMAYLYEYTSMLGAMRRELPPLDAKMHGGWRLAPQAAMQGDSAGKRLAADARKVLEKLAKEHPGTPWEVLAKRERFTALGLDWQPIK